MKYWSRLSLALLGAVSLLLVAQVIAATSGPRSGGTFANDATVGTVAWTNPGNAISNNAVYASANIDDLAASQYLKATNFGFTIPDGSTIDGILVEIEWLEGSCFGQALENSIKIVKGGTVTGSEKSTGAVADTSPAYASYGGATDLWGTTWTVAEINASGFGVAASAVEGDDEGCSVNIDHIRTTVSYTEASGGSGSQSNTAPFFLE